MYKKVFLYKRIIWFPNQLQMYKEGQRILERQRFAFPPSWLYVDNIEGEWGAFNDILKRKDSSIQTQVHFSGFTTSSKPFLEYTIFLRNKRSILTNIGREIEMSIKSFVRKSQQWLGDSPVDC